MSEHTCAGSNEDRRSCQQDGCHRHQPGAAQKTTDKDDYQPHPGQLQRHGDPWLSPSDPRAPGEPRGGHADQEVAGQALAKLQEAGWRLPTVSAEELLYRHAVVQQACGNQAEAQVALVQAWSEVQAKARTLPTAEDQRRFLDVPINQLISTGPQW